MRCLTRNSAAGQVVLDCLSEAGYTAGRQIRTKEGGHMATKYDLRDWLVDALEENGGQASIVEVCKYIWENHQDELRASGDLFFT